jgi:hypothetical protein
MKTHIQLLKLLLVFTLSIVIQLVVVGQSIPQKISFQGKLLESGNPVTGLRNFSFAITGSGWTEAHNNVSVTNGLYSVVLGETTPIPLTVFNDNLSAALEITVEGTLLTPNVNIYSSGFAFKAEQAVSAQKIAGYAVSSAAPVFGYYLQWNGTQWTAATFNESDGVIGNEITNATSGGGLVRSGGGGSANPYTLGISWGGNGSSTLASRSDHSHSGYLSGLGTSGMLTFWNGSSSLSGDAEIYWNNANKQLGIGTSLPASSAKLDVSSTTKGFLMPRMTTAQRNAISTATAGLQVFDLTTNSPWYYANSTWNEVQKTGMAWNLSGNSGNNPATSFIGNIDAQDLVFRTNNTDRIRIFGYGNGDILMSSKLGIGTSPTYRLSIMDTTQAMYIITGTNVKGKNSMFVLNYSDANKGSSYAYQNTISAIVGYVSTGMPYHFGVAGYRFDDDYGRSAGVYGGVSAETNPTSWGALGFQDESLVEWGGYFHGNVFTDGQLKITGGNPGSGRILTSDANGLASWQNGTWTYNGSNIYYNGGNVGIGTSNPSSPFEVTSSQSASNSSVIKAVSTYTGSNAIYGISSEINASGVKSYAVTGKSLGTDGFGVGMGGHSYGISGTGVEGYAYGSSGVGIKGIAWENTGVNYGVIGETFSAEGYAGYFPIGRSYFGGNVGIGTNTPTSRLQVQMSGNYITGYFKGNGNTVAYPTLYVQNSSTANGPAALLKSAGTEATLLLVQDATASGNLITGFGATGQGSNYEVAGDGTISLYNSDHSLSVQIDPSEVGSNDMGQITMYNNAGAPVIELDANYGGTQKGRATISEIELTGGADIAEPFEIEEDAGIVPGTVLSIDDKFPGQLKIANKAYDRCVAGIVSGAVDIHPGIILHNKGTKAEGDHLVALSGRVYCLADASNGAIKPGDLLTTSNVPGHAMKVTNFFKSQGAIIGKAMTSLDKGKGLVLVLVTLQ